MFVQPGCEVVGAGISTLSILLFSFRGGAAVAHGAVGEVPRSLFEGAVTFFAAVVVASNAGVVGAHS